ncbi:MAG: SOS response-associated peptidase [SAR324 cluster bacterium]|nr:SOS response-associated peptidase [SAR324 cluster bacterium]MBL7036081.1 SOS response-associated peptidase [SAR324 cluster bacterium]
MCGRFAQVETVEKVMQTFEVQQAEMQLEPRYNICPAQDIPVIVQQNGLRSLEMRSWGLIPFWAKEPKPLINARAESAADKPSFRQAFRKRRCLIPASCYYEWAVEEDQKQPYFIRLQNEIPMAFAGLWEEWRSAEGELRRTCAILTVAANSMLQEIHHRMPVIMTPKSGVQWLALGEAGKSAERLLQPFPADKMEAWRVSRQVSLPAFDSPECFKKLEKHTAVEKRNKPPEAQSSFFD